MPTEEWFKENPKVSAYIAQNLNEKLVDWMKGRNIKKVSQALTAILEEYLGVVQTEPSTEPVRDDRVEALEQKVESLSQVVQRLEEAIQASSLLVDQSKSKQEALPLLEAIAAIETKQSSHPSVEEEQDDEPDEILYDFLEPETQASDASSDGEVTKEGKTEEESRLKVGESSLNLESQKTPPPDTMNSHEVAEFIGSTYNAVGKRHRAGKVLEDKGYRFTPKKQGKNQVWGVEPL